MPLIYVQRYTNPALATVAGGTQYVEGDLSFENPTNISLASDTVFPTTSNYVLFDYSAGSFPGGQAELDTNVIPYVTSALTISQFDTLVDEPGNKRIVLKLRSRPNNGTQYVMGDLTIESGAVITLSPNLYATAGEYILFDVTGTIAPGSDTNISLSLPPGRTIVSGPTIVGSQIKITLT